jgi:hypothetical protein
MTRPDPLAGAVAAYRAAFGRPPPLLLRLGAERCGGLVEAIAKAVAHGRRLSRRDVLRVARKPPGAAP